jgi:hypothetical protein
MRTSRCRVFLVIVLACFPGAAAAQEIAAGWAHQYVEWHSLTSNAFNGISFDYAHPLGGRLAKWFIVGDGAYTRMSIDSEPFERDLTLTGGMRWTFFQRGRLSVSAQGLTGVLFWKEIPDPVVSGSDFIAAAGAGAHVKITRSLDARVQWHLWADRHRDHWWTMHRLTVSAVWVLGAR